MICEDLPFPLSDEEFEDLTAEAWFRGAGESERLFLPVFWEGGGEGLSTRAYLAAGISEKISVSLAGDSDRNPATVAASGPGLRAS